MKIEILILLVLLVAVPVVMVALLKVARSKGRSPHWIWWGIHPLVGLFALLVLLGKPPIKGQPLQRHRAATRVFCPNCGSAKVSPAALTDKELKAEGLPRFTILGFLRCDDCQHTWERPVPVWAWCAGITIGMALICPLILVWSGSFGDATAGALYGTGTLATFGVIAVVGCARGLRRSRKSRQPHDPRIS